MPLVSKPISFACRAERLAGAGSSPDGAIFGPSGETEGEGPASDAGEEMALGEAAQFIGADVLDVPFIDFTLRDLPRANKLSQPGSSSWIVLIVVVHQLHSGDHPIDIITAMHSLQRFSTGTSLSGNPLPGGRTDPQ